MDLYLKLKDFLRRNRKEITYIEFSDGTKVHCMDGAFHKEGGPAIEGPNGVKKFFFHGLETDADGQHPSLKDALEHAPGDEKPWMTFGPPHALGQPAQITPKD